MQESVIDVWLQDRMTERVIGVICLFVGGPRCDSHFAF